MLASIVAQLKRGSITNVIPFGSKTKPTPPYIVVKQEKDPIGRGYNFRIIGHMMPEQQVFLMDYMIENVSNLLREYEPISRHGNHNKLDKGVEEFPEIITGNDDGTISMERVFLMPSVLF